MGADQRHQLPMARHPHQPCRTDLQDVSSIQVADSARFRLLRSQGVDCSGKDVGSRSDCPKSHSDYLKAQAKRWKDKSFGKVDRRPHPAPVDVR